MYYLQNRTRQLILVIINCIATIFTLSIKKVAKKLKDTKDHGAIQTASIQVTKEKSKSAGAVVRDIVQYPWLGKCVHFVVKKLLKLFPVETPEDEVKLPYPEKMSDEEAAGMILHKNIPIATYKYMQQGSKCKKTTRSLGL